MNINQQLFSHPLEASALEELVKTLNFKDQIEEHYIHYEEKKRRPDLLGKTIQISEKQFPRIYQIAKKIGQQTQITVPEIFVYEDFYYAIDSKGMERPWIEISASMVNDFTDKEIEFMLAREFYKIDQKHTYYHTILQESLEMYAKGLIPFSEGMAEDIAKVVFYRWSRLAHYSADSFGFALCGNLKAGIQSVLKCVLNSVFLANHTNLSEYIKQAEKINELHDQVYEATKSDEPFPYGPFRIKYLMAYASSERAMKAKAELIKGEKR
jgi:hypothetical protein